MWYVIQVINGREDVMRERIERMVPEGAMQELFYPQYQTEIKVHGEWVKTTKPLFPGYLICDTADPRTVQQYLLRMDDFARVLAQDGQFVPLAKEEVQLIGGFTHRGDRVVPMSEALKDGDHVVVTAGPLLGHEGLIKTINRRKSTAYLELDLCGRRVTTRVGLAVLRPSSASCATLKRRSPSCRRLHNGTRRTLGGGDIVLEENVQNNHMGDAAALAVTLEDRCEAAKLNNVGKHEPKLSENGIPADVLEKLLPGDDIIELEQPVVNGGLFYRFIKRSFDVVSCGCALIILAIPMAAIAVKIKSESEGPVIYAQRRVGKDGKVFNIYKFRSMYIDAESRGAQWAQDEDPRVTPFGKFMRKTRLDEIPQFWNVFKGDMSLIGPRPERPAFCDEFEKRIHGWHYRTLVRPGISGLAQVTGGYDLLPSEKVLFDLQYIKSRNIKMDLEIMLKTLGVVSTGDGAR